MSVSDAAGSGVSLGFISADVTEQPIHQGRNVPGWQGMVGEKRRKNTKKKEPLNNNIVTATYSAVFASSASFRLSGIRCECRGKSLVSYRARWENFTAVY